MVKDSYLNFANFERCVLNFKASHKYYMVMYVLNAVGWMQLLHKAYNVQYIETSSASQLIVTLIYEQTFDMRLV